MDRPSRSNFLARLWGQRTQDARASARELRPKDALVLVVDDSPAIVMALQRMLESDGYLSVAAFDGVQAVDAARRHRPDLILYGYRHAAQERIRGDACARPPTRGRDPLR